jgi:hypothetical protein
MGLDSPIFLTSVSGVHETLIFETIKKRSKHQNSCLFCLLSQVEGSLKVSPPLTGPHGGQDLREADQRPLVVPPA